MVIEVGNDPVVAFAHFSRGFGKTGFIPIKQRKPPPASQMHKQGENKDDEAAVAYGGFSHGRSMGKGGSSLPHSKFRRRNTIELLKVCFFASLGMNLLS